MSIEWNGEGKAPVGALCRYRAFSDMPWVKCEVLAWHEDEVWLQRKIDGKTLVMGNPELFPALTEEDIEREQVIEGIVQFYIYYNGYPKGAEQYLKVAAALYDDIAAGKIPHITLK